MTREEWLLALIGKIRPWIEAEGETLPAVHVSVGWPSKSATASKQRRIGEAWKGKASADGAPHIFISPLLERTEADHVLVHELVHACGHWDHRRGFKRLATALGLEGKMTATTCSASLRTRLDAVAAEIGPYPHAVLRLAPKVKKGSRLKLAECSCGRKLRLSRKAYAEGEITCGVCDTPFLLEDEA